MAQRARRPELARGARRCARRPGGARGAPEVRAAAPHVRGAPEPARRPGTRAGSTAARGMRLPRVAQRARRPELARGAPNVRMGPEHARRPNTRAAESPLRRRPGDTTMRRCRTTRGAMISSCTARPGSSGRLTAAYLAEHAPAGRPDRSRRALAGRGSRRCATALPAERPPVGRCSSPTRRTPASLAALAAATRVVVTTVGPYAAVRAAAGRGLRRGRDALRGPDRRGAVHPRRDRPLRCARAGTGARIVHACGFDSIPSDLGVLLLHERARGRRRGRACATSGWSRRPEGRRQRRHDRLDARARSTRCAGPGRAPARRRPATRSARTAPPSRTLGSRADPGRLPGRPDRPVAARRS